MARKAELVITPTALDYFTKPPSGEPPKNLENITPQQPQFNKIATISRALRPWTRESEREKESVLILVTD